MCCLAEISKTAEPISIILLLLCLLQPGEGFYGRKIRRKFKKKNMKRYCRIKIRQVDVCRDSYN